MVLTDNKTGKNMNLFEWLEPSFMKNAFFALLIACPLFGALGTSVVTNRMSFFSDAIGHSALTGIAIGVILGIKDVTVSMICFSLLLGYAVISVKRKGRASSDTIIGVFSSVSVALGIVLLSSGGNFARYQKFLVGDILSIKTSEIFFLLAVAVLFLLVWIFFYNKMLLVSLHAVFAKSRGIHTFFIEQMFAALTAVIVTVSIRWVGLLVINSLLVLPAASSRMVARDSKSYIFVSVLISLFCGITGLIMSYYLDSASGASIVLVNALCFLVCLIISSKTLIKKR